MLSLKKRLSIVFEPLLWNAGTPDGRSRMKIPKDYDEFHDLGIRIFDGHFTFASLFLIAEFDRVRSLQIDREGQQLRKQYDGSIRFASCSQETDQRNIWDEIGDKVEEVDRAIDVLISAGMSSPALRTAAKSGVDVKGAGHAELAIAFTVLGPLQGVTRQRLQQELFAFPSQSRNNCFSGRFGWLESSKKQHPGEQGRKRVAVAIMKGGGNR